MAADGSKDSGGWLRQLGPGSWERNVTGRHPPPTLPLPPGDAAGHRESGPMSGVIFKPFHHQPRPIRNSWRPPVAGVNPVGLSLDLVEGSGFLEEASWQLEWWGAERASEQRLVPTGGRACPCVQN